MSKLSLFHNHYKSTAANPADIIGDCVLLHGWGMHSIVFDDIVPNLLQRFNVFVIDLPGMGQSPMPAGEYTLEYLTQHILNIAPKDALWLGWSLGGLLTTHIAATHPEYVKHYITVSTNLCFTQKDDWPYAMPAKIFKGFQTMYDEDAEGTQIRFLALNAKGASSMRDDIKKLKEILNFCGLPSRKALREALVILDQVDLRPELAKITQNSLHIFGEKDNLVPAQAIAEIEALYKLSPGKAQTAILSDTAHVPFISSPELFNKALNDFISGTYGEAHHA